MTKNMTEKSWIAKIAIAIALALISPAIRAQDKTKPPAATSPDAQHGTARLDDIDHIAEESRPVPGSRLDDLGFQSDLFQPPKFKSKAAPDQRFESIEKAIAELAKDLNQYDRMLRAQEKQQDDYHEKDIDRVRKLIDSYFNILADAIYSEPASLNPSALDVYSPLRASNGLPMLASLKSVDTYLDGYKLTVDLGNPNFATLSNCEVVVRWGPTTKQLDPKLPNSRTIKLSRTLPPGSWTPIEIIVPSAKAHDLGAISISLNVDTVGLSR